MMIKEILSNFFFLFLNKIIIAYNLMDDAYEKYYYVLLQFR